ncbi:transcriptional regulator [Enterobacter hormaechei subsp. hoffmannii]|uniref:response regulator transcription factor n=1 Tax=Enterobacter hormaechei TaxID=158836 RepID=UPI0006437CDE|nr:response regulator transcription factor [Enterobacter hormaechei]KLR24040.1 transcriptional regulator [Enterobacter hormaechei subsp. hoffmannii]HEM8722214.1 response regulator transcription factor [Enterobacter hormaechei]
MRQRIVIADDHPVFLVGLRAVITSAFNENFVVSGECNNVDSLLYLLEKDLPDILLTDFNMPGQRQSDGLRLIETLHRKYPSLPIVVITSIANAGIVQSMLAKGVYAVINKQSLTVELTLCLKSILQGQRYIMNGEYAPSADMSPRELEVVRLLAQGKSVNDIAAVLKRTKQTISSQKKSAMNKIGVSSTAELLEYLRNVGL